MNKEIWKPVKGYEGIYEVSNLGRVKSLERIVKRSNGKKYTVNEIILKGILNSNKYLTIHLHNQGVQKTKYIHKLVAESFLNHTPCGYKLVVNHINFDRKDNRVENLEIVTARENTNQKHLKSSSDYTGVSWHKPTKKWQATISINSKLKHLGLFTDEYQAHLAYQSALAQLNNSTQKQTILNL
jgi:hypothetical protein